MLVDLMYLIFVLQDSGGFCEDCMFQQLFGDVLDHALTSGGLIHKP